VKWSLRWVAARRDIWRPTQLQAAVAEVGFTPSLSKVAALWSGKPVTVRLDDLDRICAALECTVADLMEAEPRGYQASRDQGDKRGVGDRADPGPVRPIPGVAAVERCLPTEPMPGPRRQRVPARIAAAGVCSPPQSDGDGRAANSSTPACRVAPATTSPSSACGGAALGLRSRPDPSATGPDVYVFVVGQLAATGGAGH
jgi:DNA-binding Xre family transcriptional regulator